MHKGESKHCPLVLTLTYDFRAKIRAAFALIGLMRSLKPIMIRNSEMNNRRS